MRIQEALDRYLLQLEADGRSPHTRAQYARHVGLLAAWLNDPDVDLVDHELLARFLVSEAARLRPDGKPKKAAALNCLRSSLRTFWAWAHAAGYVARNPARLIRRARCGPPPPRALSDDEQQRLMGALASARGEAAERDHALFHVMLATGIRLGSALGLDVEDVDLERGELLLRHCKNGRVEVVFLGRAVRNHLARFIGARVTGPLFRGRHGGRLGARQAQRRFELWCAATGIGRHATSHSLRHSFATALYARTGDVLLVKEALRHRSVVSTLVYAACPTSRLRSAIEALAG
jgi:site-specific recombinase XerC